jgi:hypothetical protein
MGGVTRLHRLQATGDMGQVDGPSLLRKKRFLNFGLLFFIQCRIEKKLKEIARDLQQHVFLHEID